VLRGWIVILLLSIGSGAKDYRTNPQVVAFMDRMEQVYHFKRSYLERILSSVTPQPKALKCFVPRPITPMTPQRRAILNRLYPKYGAWDRYIKYRLTPQRIRQGKAFLATHRRVFDQVEKRYGVPREYVAAIIGIETVYGANVGKFPLFDTLVTLAFEPNRRNRFFRKQLEAFIVLVYRQKLMLHAIKGSYAGAIGLGQFIPSNYEAYGVDMNGDGKIRLLEPADAIASIANYLKQNGWRAGEVVATRVSYEGNRFHTYPTGYNRTYRREALEGIAPKYAPWDYHDKVRLIKLNRTAYDELWYGAKNFYVLTRYNHSAYYAMAVHQLAVALR